MKTDPAGSKNTGTDDKDFTKEWSQQHQQKELSHDSAVTFTLESLFLTVPVKVSFQIKWKNYPVAAKT